MYSLTSCKISLCDHHLNQEVGHCQSQKPLHFLFGTFLEIQAGISQACSQGPTLLSHVSYGGYNLFRVCFPPLSSALGFHFPFSNVLFSVCMLKVISFDQKLDVVMYVFYNCLSQCSITKTFFHFLQAHCILRFSFLVLILENHTILLYTCPSIF